MSISILADRLLWLRVRQSNADKLNIKNTFLTSLYGGKQYYFRRIIYADKEVNRVLADNLIFLRNIKGLTQEQVAEIIGISRQSYSKWEQGDTYPDIDKCDKLAQFYGVTIDSLIHQDDKVGDIKVAPAPVGKHLWGTVAIGSKGQIVIPKAARDTLGLKEGDRLVVLGDEAEGIALVKADTFEKRMREAIDLSQKMND